MEPLRHMNSFPEQQESHQKELTEIYRSLARHLSGIAEAYKQLHKYEEMKRTNDYLYSHSQVPLTSATPQPR